MTRLRLPLTTVFILGVLAPSITSTIQAADDFATAPFAFRYPGALNSFNHYADIAAKGGASAASRFGSSVNLGALAWTFPVKFDYGLSTMYSNVDFESGTQLHFFTQVATFDAGDAGVFRLGFGEITSNERPVYTAIPLDFNFDFLGGRLDWSKKIVEDVGIGFGVGYSQSETIFKAPAFDISDSSQDAYNVRGGIFWSPAEKWFVGFSADYFFRDSEIASITPTPGGFLRNETNTEIHQYVLQPGIAYEYAKAAMIHFDYKWQHFDGETESLDIHRFMAGSDIRASEELIFRVGGGVDHHGNASWTAGVGLYYFRPFIIDLAYQNGVFPEIEREFGDSRTLNISVSYQW